MVDQALYLSFNFFTWLTASQWVTDTTHYIQQRDRERKKMAAMRAHNIGFLQAKPLALGKGQVICLGFQFARCPFQTEHLHQLQACRHGCWCGCWLHSSGSQSGWVGWSPRGWQAGGLAGSGRWESCACPVGTCGRRWSGYLQEW